MIELLGWIGGVLFAICAAPEAWQSYKLGRTGIHGLTLIIWLSGEIITLAYVMLKHGLDGPLVFNYAMNLVFLSIIIYYKIKPRKELDISAIIN